MPTFGYHYKPKFKSVDDLRQKSLAQLTKKNLNAGWGWVTISASKLNLNSLNVVKPFFAKFKSKVKIGHFSAPLVIQSTSAKPKLPAQLEPLANSSQLNISHIKPVKSDSRPISPRVERLLWVLIAFVMVNTVLMSVQLLNGNGNIATANFTTQQENVATIPAASGSGIKVMSEFSSNKAITDIGYNLKVQKGTIQTKGHTNCNTPSAPAVENGCGFSLIPSAMGIPTRGVLFKSIQFQGTFGQNSRLRLDIKDFEKGILTTQIASLDGLGQINKKTDLPEQINQTSGIFVRFWTDKEIMVINKIAIEYYSVDNLHKVQGKISPELAAQGVMGYIYQDSNQNGLFDEKTDQLWLCRPNFPGLKPVEINLEGNFLLLRDDSCYIDVKPDKWYTDSSRLSLPAGKWILVLGDNRGQYPFEIKNTEDEQSLDFTKINS
jgi:hypothetical protein